MTNKEIKILDNLIQELCEKQDRIKIMRQTLGINTDFDFLREAEIIEYLYKSILQERKKIKSTYLETGTSGWFVEYFRDKKTYKEGEKFHVRIYFSFVWGDTFK